MLKVDFFIIGAPKCGTTSFCSWLKEHPDICFSIPRDPNFYSGDIHMALNSEWYFDDEEKYLQRCFAHKTSVQRFLCEGSAFYLYSKTAIPSILLSHENAKFVVLLRNPIEMILSYHSELLYGGRETISDFWEAWLAQEKRKEGFLVPGSCGDVKILFYKDVCSLGTQVERLLSLVDREKVHFIFMDDLKKDPRKEYVNALEFLGVEDDGRTEFSHLNPNKTWAHPALPRFLRTMSKLKSSLGIHKMIGINDLFVRVFTKKSKRKPLQEWQRRELVGAFAEEIDKLSFLLQRDLSSWKIFNF